MLSSSARISPRSAIVSRTRRPRAKDVSSCASSGGRSRAVDIDFAPCRFAPCASRPIGRAFVEFAVADRLDERLDIGYVLAHSQAALMATDRGERGGAARLRTDAKDLHLLGLDGV